MKELDGRAKLLLRDEGIRDEGGIMDPKDDQHLSEFVVELPDVSDLVCKFSVNKGLKLLLSAVSMLTKTSDCS
ncbi:hypothetical protein KIN20_011340 [Parelaphostrongylus tenuis]|uniref:Uncharacterized protein n=1 Tax=Parelaphostrongylus tenuis TaxID=148309 RepID=A0AAD5MAU2_PARTN|nr:hypothetical protein KIN20_011340 [Parelaphostrongylus tenuis]